MRNTIILIAFALVGMIWGCNSSKSSLSANKPSTADGKHFGEKISADQAMAYDDLIKTLQGKDSLEAKVLGTVEDVCQMKGCWMNLVSTRPEQPALFVQFKDYGFFMPKDISGRKVVIQGYAYRSVTSVEQLRHYAEDAGKSPVEIQAITKPKEELKFLASGVLLLD
jgi:hypothetical protein